MYEHSKAGCGVVGEPLGECGDGVEVSFEGGAVGLPPAVSWKWEYSDTAIPVRRGHP